MHHLYEHFVSYISRARINGPVRIFCKPWLLLSVAYFSRINDPIFMEAIPIIGQIEELVCSENECCYYYVLFTSVT